MTYSVPIGSLVINNKSINNNIQGITLGTEQLGLLSQLVVNVGVQYMKISYKNGNFYNESNNKVFSALDLFNTGEVGPKGEWVFPECDPYAEEKNFYTL